MMPSKVLLASGFVLVLSSGCSSAQTVNAGTASDGGSAGLGLALVVTYRDQSVPVDLGSVASSTYKGVTLLRLADVWDVSRISADRTILEFEFVASDGFKPSDKGCVDLSGSVLDQGYIDPTSRNLTWDEALGFRGCYSVKGTAEMNAHEPTGAEDAGTSDAPLE